MSPVTVRQDGSLRRSEIALMQLSDLHGTVEFVDMPGPATALLDSGGMQARFQARVRPKLQRRPSSQEART